MSKPKRDPFKLKTLERKRPARGARTTNVLPFYRAIGNGKSKPAETLDMCDWIPERHRGRVLIDFDETGEPIGVRIVR